MGSILKIFNQDLGFVFENLECEMRTLDSLKQNLESREPRLLTPAPARAAPDRELSRAAATRPPAPPSRPTQLSLKHDGPNGPFGPLAQLRAATAHRYCHIRVKKNLTETFVASNKYIILLPGNRRFACQIIWNQLNNLTSLYQLTYLFDL